MPGLPRLERVHMGGDVDARMRRPLSPSGRAAWLQRRPGTGQRCQTGCRPRTLPPFDINDGLIDRRCRRSVHRPSGKEAVLPVFSAIAMPAFLDLGPGAGRAVRDRDLPRGRGSRLMNMTGVEKRHRPGRRSCPFTSPSARPWGQSLRHGRASSSPASPSSGLCPKLLRGIDQVAEDELGDAHLLSPATMSAWTRLRTSFEGNGDRLDRHHRVGFLEGSDQFERCVAAGGPRGEIVVVKEDGDGLSMLSAICCVGARQCAREDEARRQCEGQKLSEDNGVGPFVREIIPRLSARARHAAEAIPAW